jgi:putative SOS response-associated peptidase YedK
VCGRFTQQRPTSELAEIFEAEDLAGDPGDHYNVAPTDEAAVVVQRDDRRAVVRYRWGLIPHWADEAMASRTFNARAETVAVAPAFRTALVRRRCLVPVDSFYEWRREGAVRQPYRIVRSDGRPLVLAGLWSGWREPETGDIRRTFTIITTRATERIADLHDRMPVILAPERWSAWLDTVGTDRGELQGLLVAAEDEPLEIYPVPTLVNNVRSNGAALVAPLA